MDRALKFREDYYFDRAAGDRVVRFFAKHIRHVEGELRGKLFKLERWQHKLLRRLFGWFSKTDKTRKYRSVFLFVPRKNGKSTFAAGVALYLLFADKEPAANIVSAAGDEEQAMLIFDMAKQMMAFDPMLSEMGKSFAASIVDYKNGSNYMPLSKVAKTKHGKNLHGIIFDELHAQDDRDLFDVLQTSTGARRQPMEVYTTTAGFDKESICYEQYEYAKQCAADPSFDPTFFPAIFEAIEPDDDPNFWQSEAFWLQANPNFGISIKKAYFEKEVRKAKNNPAYENTFKRLHLNIWTEQDVRAVPMHEWEMCGDKYQFEEADLYGEKCWLGLDLSSRNDLSALALLFKWKGPNDSWGKEIWTVVMRFWCPQKVLFENRSKKRYAMWEKKGILKTCPGGRIDYKDIRKEINDLSKLFNIQEIAVDPWNAHQLSTELEEEDGFTLVQIRQGIYSLSDPTKEFLTSIGEVEFAHGNNLVLTWNARNLATEEDSAGNLKPSKNKSKEKIDGCVAIITGLARGVVAKTESTIYDGRGVQSW